MTPEEINKKPQEGDEQKHATSLFRASPDLRGLPMGSFHYACRQFAQRHLPEEIMDLFGRMSEGIEEPRLTYHLRFLRPKERIGHGRWHCDGREDPDEIHRLLTIGGVPTLGHGGAVLHAGTVWEYGGAYRHMARPAEKLGIRLMMRVSKTSMFYRNVWALPPNRVRGSNE
jgi:hypothetical protein